MPTELWLPLSFLCIAYLYASAGFGGGSSYLALLAFAGLPFQEIRLVALLCNVIVVSSGTWVFIRHQQLPFRKLWPLVLASVPMAYLGAVMKIHENTFFLLLGISLCTAAVFLWVQPMPVDNQVPAKPFRESLIGGSIGLLSGVVGIGGGIFLSPVLHFLRWDSSRKIAATASFFILVNSVSGLAGQLSHLPQNIDIQRITLLGLAVLLGGQLGSRLSMAKYNLLAIRRVTAVLVLAAGLEVVLRSLGSFCR